MEDVGRAVAHDLEKYLSALGTIATVAPLMGLFGTVVGMIEIFGAQAPGGTNPQQLAHGISVALYNTALGILIAIPALIVYRHFRARVDAYLVEMEQQAVRLADLPPSSLAVAAAAAVRAAQPGPAFASPPSPVSSMTGGAPLPGSIPSSMPGALPGSPAVATDARKAPVRRVVKRASAPAESGSGA